MIKFFRKIRKNLLIENKTGKYFKYAIGEIILVVIGILIALQINNWNNNRINSNRETDYIKNITRDLNNQLKALDIQTEFEANVVKQCEKVLRPYNKNNKLIMDRSFAVSLGAMTSRRTFINTNPVYTELVSSGNIQLLKNEGFKDQLINFYQELGRIEKVIDGNNSLFTDQEFSPVMLQFGVLDTTEDSKSLSKSFKNSIEIKPPLTDANINRLLSISRALLQKEENELLVVNYIAARQDYANLHVFFLGEFRKETEALLKSIKDY